jgi:ubiquinone/menaquinone biosynthesis C-methylase UbiE
MRAMCGKARSRGAKSDAGWLPFEKLADEYDAWFDSYKGRRIFRAEADCLRDLLKNAPRPWLEIGVGTGRFAEELNIEEGIDPSPAALKYAADRGVHTRVGRAENLPYKNRSIGAAVMVVTICFLEDPGRAFKECGRILKKDGCAIVGLVPKDSKWGEVYERKGAEGHNFYSVARFYTAQQVIESAELAGLQLERSVSSLFEAPERKVKRYLKHQEGLVKGAGFVAMRFKVLSAILEK